MHAAIARQVRVHAQRFGRPCALISGGETTVTVGRKDAKGDRNGELALALELGGLEGVYALAADTDRVASSEDNSGVFLTPDRLERLGKARARTFLEANNSYKFFREQDALIVTGTTHTNVNDLRILLLL